MAVYNKTFTNSNDTPLPTHDAAWTTLSGGITCEVFGNWCTGSDNGGSFNANYLNETFADKHYAIASFTANPDSYHGVIIRAQSGANSFFYAIRADDGTVFAGEQIAGSPTDWDAGQTGWSSTDTVELHVDATTSTTIHLKRNGATIETYTSKGNLTGGFAGVCTVATNDGTGISAWEGGDVSAGGANTTLTASQGSLAITGQAAGLKRALMLPAAQGSYTLAGQNATLTAATAARTLTAASGTYAITGSDARVDLQITAAFDTYNLTGQPARLSRDYRLTAVQGSYVLVGFDPNLLYSGSGPKVITADSGTYNITGQGATLRRAAVLTSSRGLYSLDGFAVASVGAVTDTGTSSSGVLKVRKVLAVSTSGRTKWVHYIPVKQVSDATGDEGRTDNTGCVEVELLSSGTGLTEWVDYIPVVEVADGNEFRWRYDNSGWIPILIVE